MSSDAPASTALDIALAVPVRDGRVLVAFRSPDRPRGGCWAFPGGKIEPDESPLDAARRELLEETGLSAETWLPLIVVDHDDGGGALRLHTYVAEELSGTLAIEDGEAHAWRAPGDLRAEDMPPANRAILNALRWRLG